MLKFPCGCDSRKEIMFEQGQPGKPELVIIGVVLTMVLVACVWRINT